MRLEVFVDHPGGGKLLQPVHEATGGGILMSTLEDCPEHTSIILEVTDFANVCGMNCLGNGTNHCLVVPCPCRLGLDNIFSSGDDMSDICVFKMNLHDPAPVLIVGVGARGFELLDCAGLTSRMSRSL
jgi:hypothetical protein